MSNTPTTINHLFIVDTSARNLEDRRRLISRVNDSLHAIRQSVRRQTPANTRITLMTAEGQKIKCSYHDLAICDVQDFLIHQDINGKTTQLFDAIGSCLATWRALGHRHSNKEKHFVSIFTQGIDTGSKKYACCTLKAIIKSLILQDWQFTLIGSNSLLPFIAKKLGINNYYNQGAPVNSRERNFLISRLKRQWQQQQLLSQSMLPGTRAA